MADDRPASNLGQQKRKRFNDATNQLHKLLEGWDNRLTFENIAESYLKAKLRIVVELRAIFGLHSEHFCAVFQRAGDTDETAIVTYGKCSDRNDPQLNNNHRIDSSERYEQAVFVKNIQLMQPAERVVPSLVRFKTPDEIACCLAGTLYCSFTTGFKLFPVGARENGESSSICDRSAIGQNNLTGKMVKARSQIVDRIARNQRNAIGGRFDEAELYNSIATLRLVIGDSLISAGFEKRYTFNAEIHDVLFGPFDLG
jgi:hypothetical protein